jgi:hypothetical protein
MQTRLEPTAPTRCHFPCKTYWKYTVFDHAYGWDSAQQTLYEDLGRPIVEQALRGFNGTIFAYGQTGSGKTFSMMGDESNPGIIPLLNGELFQRLAAMQAEAPNRSFLVLVSFLEVSLAVVRVNCTPSSSLSSYDTFPSTRPGPGAPHPP